MSQDISTSQSTSEPVSESIPLQPWSAEAYADKLMDDLFSDIDRILDGSSKLPTEPAKSEYISLQPVKMPQITMPSAVMSLGQVLAPPSDAATVKQQPAKSDAVSEARSSTTPVPKAGQYFNKILLGVTCGSLVVTLILWWANHEKLSLPRLNLAATSHQNTLSSSDAQFINYMLRSLELIDRKTQISQQQTNSSVLPAKQLGMPVYSQPSPPAASNLPQAPNPAPTVVGIYIPGYPTPQYQPFPNAQLAPPLAGSIHPAAPSSIRPSAPSSIRPSAGDPVSSQPSQPPVTRGSAPPVPTAQMPIPAPAPVEAKHTLVGLLYLGDRSAALFDISGVTQRIQVGEPIGASGWTLVAVTKEEAIIRRNGEVRSIYTGQKF